MSANKSSESNIKRLVGALVESYNAEPDIINIENDIQIDPEIIREIITDLRALIFAGYYDNRKLKSDSIEYYAGEIIERLIYNLSKQIGKALHQVSEYDEASIPATSERMSLEFLSKLPELRTVLATDVDASYEGDPAAWSKKEVILSYPGICAITIYRLAHELYLAGVPLIPRMMTEYAHGITGIDIHPGATIGHHFFLDHGTGIVIGETTLIGNFVKVYQGVTLGALSTRGGQVLTGVKRHPTIENHVTIYSGASILGGATIIGEGVVIGSNAFITKSVPEKTRVSVRNPELQFQADEKTRSIELQQDEFWSYSI
jgi:serine O-acetyltransferase